MENSEKSGCPRCKGVTLTGKRCRKPTCEHTGRCFLHKCTRCIALTKQGEQCQKNTCDQTPTCYSHKNNQKQADNEKSKLEQKEIIRLKEQLNGLEEKLETILAQMNKYVQPPKLEENEIMQKQLEQQMQDVQQKMEQVQQMKQEMTNTNETMDELTNDKANETTNDKNG